MDYDSDEGRMAAAEQLAAHNPRAAAEALRAIACDDGVGDEVRLSAAEQLPALDPQAAAEAFAASLVTDSGTDRRHRRPHHGRQDRHGKAYNLRTKRLTRPGALEPAKHHLNPPRQRSAEPRHEMAQRQWQLCQAPLVCDKGATQET